MTKDEYPPEKSYLSFDDKKAAKYACPLSIVGFGDFETKLDVINNKDEFKDAFNRIESFTIRNESEPGGTIVWSGRS